MRPSRKLRCCVRLLASVDGEREMFDEQQGESSARLVPKGPRNKKQATRASRPFEFFLELPKAQAFAALFFKAFLATATNSAKPAASWAAMSASTLRSKATWAAFKPSMNRL